MSFKYTLRKGDEGQEVRRLQSKLPVREDGKFGSKTERAVRDYQNHNNLVVDGLAGNQTLCSLGIPVLPGVDLSAWNGTVDFKKLKEAGVKYAIIKLTEGTTHRNRGFEKKYEDARKHGIAVGAYHFGRPDTYVNNPKDAEREAENFLLQLEKVGLESGDIIPTLDVEKGVKVDDNYNCDWIINWMDLVEKETNVKSMIYTARWAYQLYIMRADVSKQSKVASYPLWLASYNSGIAPKRKVKIWDNWDIWQYTGTGAVDGCKGRVDLNWMAGGQLEKLSVK